ncbi:trehalose-phosphatase [Halopiger goleimassiliensis]|uniref:trehalose-phosphatase n=1 Tax=Halopiger goleimassiliensis TaxID=1293048 RepID=UPI0006778B14|nr:trehalose-phosphatase [Halopiger goleimassiliensis]
MSGQTTEPTPATAPSTPDPLEDRLSELRGTLESATRLLLCLDFDGTLAPIVDDPDAATPLPESRARLEAIAADPRVRTAIVSGRALSDVRTRIEGPSVYAGNHGLELARNGSIAVHPVARSRANRLAEVRVALKTALAPFPGVELQDKRLTATVHLRSVPEPLRPLVRRRTTAIVDRLAGDDLELSDGKRILEIEPAIPWGKGNAVALLESDQPAGAVTVYVGDDVTDESAFRAVEPQGIGVRVGGTDPSAASYRVESPREVAAFLGWLESIDAGRKAVA